MRVASLDVKMTRDEAPPGPKHKIEMLMLEKKKEENKLIHSYHQCFFLMISTEPQARESNFATFLLRGLSDITTVITALNEQETECINTLILIYTCLHCTDMQCK